MFLKFLKHELKVLVSGIGNFFDWLLMGYWVAFKWSCIIALVFLPILAWCGLIKRWFFWVELLGVIIWWIYHRYQKFKKNADTTVPAEDDEDDEFDIDDDEYDLDDDSDL